VKRQYLALLALLVAFIALSLWIASQTNLQNIESRITSAGNESHQGSDGIIEGGMILPYLAITGVLLAAGIAIYWILEKRRSR
jgi:uncharacterized BrkB/YihY/UPF0761 family membrane protein